MPDHTTSEPAERLYDWSVKRSGAGLTVSGANEDGERVSFSNVNLVQNGRFWAVLATPVAQPEGVQFELVNGPRPE